MTDASPLDVLGAWPRARFARLPTPLEEAPSLEAALSSAGPSLLLKRDDETGFALGGNKVRKLEFELAPERLDGVTHLVTAGGAQSNHARVTAAAAATLGLQCVLVVSGPTPEPPRGNALLHRMFGARIRSVASREDRTLAMDSVADEIAAKGGRALVVPIGASAPLGALGYARATVELCEQLSTLRATVESERTWIVVASSSCGTAAGVLTGLTLLGRTDVRLLAVSADETAEDIRSETLRIARGALRLLGARDEPGLGFEAIDSEVGPGYGVSTAQSIEAMAIFAQEGGVLLDPVYTAKAAAALIGRVRGGRFDRRDSVVFWHTGGHPALFA